MLTPLVFLALLAALGWYVIDGLKARELGVVAARQACQREGLQFLDDSVATQAVRLARRDDGRLTVQRSFSFEFSDNGDNRLPGSVTVLGDAVSMLYLSPYARDTPRVHTQGGTCSSGCGGGCH